MKIVLWLTLFCVVAICGAATLRSEPRPPEVRIVTDPNIEKRVEKLEAAVKTIEEHLQRKGSLY